MWVTSCLNWRPSNIFHYHCWLSIIFVWIAVDVHAGAPIQSNWSPLHPASWTILSLVGWHVNMQHKFDLKCMTEHWVAMDTRRTTFFFSSKLHYTSTVPCPSLCSLPWSQRHCYWWTIVYWECAVKGYRVSRMHPESFLETRSDGQDFLHSSSLVPPPTPLFSCSMQQCTMGMQRWSVPSNPTPHCLPRCHSGPVVTEMEG